MNRSASVTVIAILAMIGSGLALAMGALTAVGLLLGPGPRVYGDYPGSPVFFRAMMLLVPLIYILPGICGIVTGVGLLQMKAGLVSRPSCFPFC